MIQQATISTSKTLASNGNTSDKYIYLNAPFTFKAPKGYTYSSQSRTNPAKDKNGKEIASAMYSFGSNVNTTDADRMVTAKFSINSANAHIRTTSGKEASNATLNLIFMPITYTLTYNGNGATSGSMSTKSYVYDMKYMLRPDIHLLAGRKRKEEDWHITTRHSFPI